jgi:hypothetical protein
VSRLTPIAERGRALRGGTWEGASDRDCATHGDSLGGVAPGAIFLSRCGLKVDGKHAHTAALAIWVQIGECSLLGESAMISQWTRANVSPGFPNLGTAKPGLQRRRAHSLSTEPTRAVRRPAHARKERRGRRPVQLVVVEPKEPTSMLDVGSTVDPEDEDIADPL